MLIAHRSSQVSHRSAHPSSARGARALALLGLLAVLLLAVDSGASALAAPITVNLRVEGSTTTLYEGPVSTAAATFETPSSAGTHPCDYASNGPEGGFADEGTPSGTPTTALRDAALGSGLAFDAKWFGGASGSSEPGDFFITKVGPDANGGAPTFPSWGYAVNFAVANVGGCQIRLAPGNEVLWAYNYNNLAHFLALSGPASAEAGAPFTVHVADGQTGEPIAGASIGELAGGVTTPIPRQPADRRGGQRDDRAGRLRDGHAEGTEAGIRCARTDCRVRARRRRRNLRKQRHDSATTTSGTTKSSGAGTTKSTAGTAAGVIARMLGLQSGHVYSRRSAPRVLRGAVRWRRGHAASDPHPLGAPPWRALLRLQRLQGALRALSQMRARCVLLGWEQRVVQLPAAGAAAGRPLRVRHRGARQRGTHDEPRRRGEPRRLPRQVRQGGCDALR